MNQRLESQQTPHISPSRASYGVSIVRIWEKIDRVITAPHCILLKTDHVLKTSHCFPCRYKEIESKYGCLQKLAEVDLDAPEKVEINVYYEEQQLRLLLITTLTVREMLQAVAELLEMPAKDLKFMYQEHYCAVWQEICPSKKELHWVPINNNDSILALKKDQWLAANTLYTGLILGLRPANERRCYNVMPSLIGWAQTWWETLLHCNDISHWLGANLMRDVVTM